jgi:hypothetical protein
MNIGEERGAKSKKKKKKRNRNPADKALARIIYATSCFGAIPLLRSFFRALKSLSKRLADACFFLRRAGPDNAPRPTLADRGSGSSSSSSTYSTGTGTGTAPAQLRDASDLVWQAGIRVRVSTCPNMLSNPPPRWLRVSLGPPYLRCAKVKSLLPFRIAEVSGCVTSLFYKWENGFDSPTTRASASINRNRNRK